MVIIFALIFLLSVTWFGRIHWKFTRTATIILFFYFFLAAEVFDLFFQITFSYLLQKLLLFLVLSVIPFAVIHLCSEYRLRRLLVSIGIAFIFLLPFTRSTKIQPWIASMFPVRFIEDVSRMKPDPSESDIDCKKLSAANRSMITGRLWRLNLPQTMNGCLANGSSWHGPKPVNSGAKVARTLPYDEWREMFRESSFHTRLQLFDELRLQRNKSLVQEAVASLDSNNDALIVAAVKYLRTVSGKPFGYEKQAWIAWAGSPVAEMKINLQTNPEERSELLQKGFSAVDVQNDFFIAKERNLDFLGLYLREHFPKKITDDDLKNIQAKLKQLSPDLTTRLGYRKGILLFLLALSETKMYVDSGTGDPVAINARWKECIQSLQDSRELGAAMANEIELVLSENDLDENGSLDQSEFKKLLNRRAQSK
jgi:hypothetical protein